MKIKLFLLLAVLVGSAAGFLTSNLIYQDLTAATETSNVESQRPLAYLFRQRSTPAQQVGKNHERVKEPFRDVIARANESTVRLRVNGKQVALGVIVDAHGLILTKLSELKEPLQCAIPGGRVYDATIVGRDVDSDLALVRIAKSGLRPARWTTVDPELGNWVAVPGGKGDLPVVIGVISAPPHAVPQEKAILGVVLSESGQGPRVDQVIQQSIAARIGLSAGDIIQQIDAQPLHTSRQLVEYVSGLLPGAQVRLNVLRDGESRVLDATLGRLSELMAADQGMEEELNRELSVRRSGFPRVLQHDSILPSYHCGGPLVDLEGRVVGLNIARAGRIATYTLPTSVVKEVLPRLMLQASQ